jgi:hypothetical protein
MSSEERLKLIIGDLVIRVAVVESEKEAMASELDKLKKQLSLFEKNSLQDD